MFVNFKGNCADLYTDTKQIIRRFHVSNEIVNVAISGNGNDATIAITMKNGKTIVYKANGQIVRK